jgi:hypothetical protein
MKLLRVETSKNDKKKYDAIFDIDGKEKRVSFGASGMSDYTIHKDPERRNRYILRHQVREDWKDPLKPGTLSRYILWEKTNIDDAIRAYKKRFSI